MSPFRQNGGNKQEINERAMHSTVSFPSDFPADARSVVQALLTRDPSQRLGCGPGGVADVKKHAFFAPVDWDALADHKVSPPLKPFQGQVNARDVYDIERLNQYETKKVVITAEDNSKYYSSFNHMMSHHWQREVLSELLLLSLLMCCSICGAMHVCVFCVCVCVFCVCVFCVCVLCVCVKGVELHNPSPT